MDNIWYDKASYDKLWCYIKIALKAKRNKDKDKDKKEGKEEGKENLKGKEEPIVN